MIHTPVTLVVLTFKGIEDCDLLFIYFQVYGYREAHW